MELVLVLSVGLQTFCMFVLRCCDRSQSDHLLLAMSACRSKIFKAVALLCWISTFAGNGVAIYFLADGLVANVVLNVIAFLISSVAAGIFTGSRLAKADRMIARYERETQSDSFE